MYIQCTMYNVLGWAVTDSTERLVAEIDADLKARVKADPRTIREITESALRSEFATGASAAVERRIDEKRQRINMLERERNERERELAEERDELERLETQLNTFNDETDAQIQKAREALQDTPLEPTNPAVKNHAEKIGISATELISRLE